MAKTIPHGKSRGMTSSCCRRKGVPSTGPKFFKIILDPLADSMRIPAEFRKRCGQNLPRRVFLKVPSGSMLEVELIQSNGETLLQKGWKEFKERYSIGVGYFLVFEYNGSSQFDVLIFDTSASEINYPFDADFEADRVPKVEDNGTESDDSIMLLEEFVTSNGGNGETENFEDSDKAETAETDVSIEVLDNPLARQQNRRKRRRCDDTIGFSGYYQLRKSVKEPQNLSSCLKNDSRSKFSSSTYHPERIPRRRVKLEESTSEEWSDGTGTRCSDRVQKQRTVAKETCIAYQKAIAFTCARTFRNPFFISLMQPSYVSGRFTLNVPFTFAKGNLPCKSNNLTIQLTNGKSWAVGCIVGKSRGQLSVGWKYFAQDNALKLGDACIFEVAKRTKLVWNVIIFRS